MSAIKELASLSRRTNSIEPKVRPRSIRRLALLSTLERRRYKESKDRKRNGTAQTPNPVLPTEKTDQNKETRNKFYKTVDHNLRRIEMSLSPQRKEKNTPCKKPTPVKEGIKTLKSSETPVKPNNTGLKTGEDATATCNKCNKANNESATSSSVKWTPSVKNRQSPSPKIVDKNVTQTRAWFGYIRQDTGSSPSTKRSPGLVSAAPKNSQNYCLVMKPDGSYRYKKLYFLPRPSQIADEIHKEIRLKDSVGKSPVYCKSPTQTKQITTRRYQHPTTHSSSEKDAQSSETKKYQVPMKQLPTTSPRLVVVANLHKSNLSSPAIKTTALVRGQAKSPNLTPGKIRYKVEHYRQKPEHIQIRSDVQSEVILRSYSPSNVQRVVVKQPTQRLTPLSKTSALLLKERIQKQVHTSQPRSNHFKKRLSSFFRRPSMRTEHDSASLTSSVINSMSCWKCLDMDGNEDFLSSLDSESGSDGNNDSNDGGGGDGSSDLDDFYNQEDIEDIEYSSGGGDGSENSSQIDANSLYQDDIITQDAQQGMYSLDDYDDEAEALAQQNSAAYLDDDYLLDVADDEERRVCYVDYYSAPDHVENDVGDERLGTESYNTSSSTDYF